MELSEREKSLLFWASFIALAAAGVGFALRVMTLGIWETEFSIPGTEAGAVFGLSLWPIAVTMILFSLILDRVGYRLSMFIACALQLVSVVFTVIAKDLTMLTTSSSTRLWRPGCWVHSPPLAYSSPCS